MKITRKSMISGTSHTLDLPVTEEEIAVLIKGPVKWSHPTLPIQEAFPNLTADEREFILTGITAEEWDSAFAIEDESDEAWGERNGLV